MKSIRNILAALFVVAGTALPMQAQNENFHIYLCIGQSNMEGNAPVEPVDRAGVPDRFSVMATADFSNPSRRIGEWYTATPPLVRQNTGLTPMDYFGRTMVANLPENVTVGVIPVAVGGCRIEHLDKDFKPAELEKEADWFKAFMREYDNHPYTRLMQCARIAQKSGVIKGILLHQGESNNGDVNWPSKVKKIYDDILNDLGLAPNSIPLLAGELVTPDMGGCCGGMNPIINSLPKTLPTARVVSAANLPQKGDALHFTAHGYRVLGCRYATEMLATMGISDPKVEYSEEIPFIPTPNPSEGDFVFDLNQFNPRIWENGSFDVATGVFQAGMYGFGGWQYDVPIDLSGYKYIVAELNEDDCDGVEFKVFDTASYWEVPYASKFSGGKLIVAELAGMMKNLPTGITPLNTAEVYRVGFWGYGNRPIHIKHVFATNTSPYEDSGIKTVAQDPSASQVVYDLAGRRVADSIESENLAPGFYISGGKKYFVGNF